VEIRGPQIEKWGDIGLVREMKGSVRVVRMTLDGRDEDTLDGKGTIHVVRMTQRMRIREK